MTLWIIAQMQYNELECDQQLPIKKQTWEMQTMEN